MRIKLLLLILFLTALSQGCATYKGVGYFHGTGEVFYVEFDKSLRSGQSYVRAYNESGLVCSGASRPVKESRFRFSCVGEEGRLLLACNDGRHLKGRWNLESCSEGQGVGGDQYGNTFIMAYGTREKDVLEKVGLAGDTPYPAFAGEGFMDPLYSAMLDYEGEGAIVLHTPRETPKKERPAPKGAPLKGQSPPPAAGLEEHIEAAPLPAEAEQAKKPDAPESAAPQAVVAPAAGLAAAPAGSPARPLPSSATGFYSGPPGRIVTMANVVEGAESVRVYLIYEKREIPARVIEIDRDSGSAMLMVDEPGVPGSAVRVRVTRP